MDGQARLQFSAAGMTESRLPECFDGCRQEQRRSGQSSLTF